MNELCNSTHNLTFLLPFATKDFCEECRTRSDCRYVQSDIALHPSLFKLPRERKVVGLIPSRDRPKPLKLVLVAFPFGAQDYGNSTTSGPPVSG